MFQTSYIELSESAVKTNIEFIKNFIGAGVTFSSVVKGNAYGHGLKEFTTMAYANGVRHFSVFDVEEAKIVFDTLGNKVTILIMGFVADDDLAWVINQAVFFPVPHPISKQFSNACSFICSFNEMASRSLVLFSLVSYCADQ